MRDPADLRTALASATDFIERRPWTALAVVLGAGALLASALGRERVRTVATSPEDGDDYLAEYEDALVNGSAQWAAQAREAAMAPVTRASWTTGLRE